MKRRKRRPDVLIFLGSLAAIALLSSQPRVNSQQQQQTIPKVFRPAIHLLGASAASPAGNAQEQHLQQLLNSHHANHSSPPPYEDVKKISLQGTKKDTLLAAAETTRLLTIGNGPQTKPPYAHQHTSSHSTSRQNSSLDFSQRERENHLIEEAAALNSSRFNVAQAHPVFLRHPPLATSAQSFRLTYPNGLTVQLSPGLKLPNRNGSIGSQSSGLLALAPTTINYLQTLQQHPPSSYTPNVPITATYLRFPYGKPDVQEPANISQFLTSDNTSVLIPSKITNSSFDTSEQLLLHQINSTTPAPFYKTATTTTTTRGLLFKPDPGFWSEKATKYNPNITQTSLGVSNSDWQEELEGDLSKLKAGNYQRTNHSGSSTWAQLLKQATDGNVMESLMVTNRSMVSLVCEADDMLVRFKFKQPFRGSIVTNLDKFKSCRLLGTGALYYEMRISLRDCGTRQESSSLYINNIQIQFHQSLDLADDEIKTIICTYPVRSKPSPNQDSGGYSSSSGGDGKPERIIENKQFPGDPQQQDLGKLVHYEPLLLVVGLIVLALALLGLTTSAYFFTTTSRQRAVSNARRLSRSSQIYRRSPSQTANRYIVPPLISVPNKETTVWAKKYPSSSPAISLKQTKQQQISRTEIKKLDNLTSSLTTVKPPIPPKPKKPQPQPQAQPQQHFLNSSDSLSDNHSDSVTTIEIPIHARNEKQHSKAQQQKQQFKEEETLKSFESNSIVINEEKVSIRRSSSSSSRRKGMRATRTDSLEAQKHSTQQQQQHSKEVQVEPKTPPFGSLRATLTSPKEYKRLQDITRLFDEILIENHIDRGDKRTIVYKTTRLSPSKYKTKIMDKMDEQQRAKLKHLLTNDELFRSLVVESTSKEIFRRKLRDSPTYSSLLMQESWQLLEEILLDKDITALE